MTVRHVLFTSTPGWGHIRPFCILAARLVNQHQDVAFTMILAPQTLKKAADEISVELRESDSEEARKRIRVLSSIPDASIQPLEGIKQMAESYSNVYSLLVAGKSVTCAATGTVFEPLPPPKVVVLDFFAVAQYLATREISGNTTPIMAWLTGHAPSLIRLFGPESMGGYGDLGAKVDAEAARLGITPEEVGDKIYREATGKIIKLPGVPEMYDWEFFAQPMPFDAVVTPIMRTVPTLLKGCDGVLAVNAHSWENEAIVGMKQWLGEWNKDVYAIGPLLPYGYGNLQQSNRGANDIQHFLDNIKVKYGEGSALLLSLGTMFWPKDTGYLEEIVEALLESDFPFILSCASPFANLREELKQKVQASGIGFITTWCPQQFILSHSATGWFLTHCGHNSVTEALGSGMPIIAWPFAADQPATAAQLSELGLGIELLEVRSGEYGTKPLRRNGKAASGNREAVGKEIREVINMCRSSKGAQMRQNAQRVKLNLQKAWDTNGPATTELNLFLERFMI